MSQQVHITTPESERLFAFRETLRYTKTHQNIRSSKGGGDVALYALWDR